MKSQFNKFDISALALIVAAATTTAAVLPGESNMHSAMAAEISDKAKTLQRNASASAATPGEPAVAGIVIESHGVWTVSVNGKSIPIKAGDAIPYRGALRFFSKGATISGRLLNGETFKYPGQAIIGKPLAPLEPESDDRPWWVIALDILTAPGGSGIAPIVRSKGDEVLKDALVRSQEGEIDLSSIFKNNIDLQRSRALTIKRLAFGPSNLQQQSRLPKGLLSVKLQPADKGLTAAKDLAPGFYEVFLLDAQGRATPTDESCWIQVVPDEKFELLSAKYNRALADAARWQKMTAERKRQLLRAYMISLMIPG